MTRIINTTLITLVAFFVFLSVLWLFVDPAAPGLGTASADVPTAASIRGVDAEWTPGGQGIDVELLVRNAGAAASITQVAYRVTLDGELVAANAADPPTTLPSGMDAPVRFAVSLPDDFGARWMHAYQSGGASTTLRIDGTIAIRHATADVRLPFQWQAASRGDLQQGLADSVQECPGPPAPVCLRRLDATLGRNGLALDIALRNDESDPLLVRSGSFQLLFDGLPVATGHVTGELEIGPGDAEDVTALLTFDADALEQWWAGHAGRCETSSLGLAMSLDVQAVGEEARAMDWDILAAPFQTQMLCKGSA